MSKKQSRKKVFLNTFDFQFNFKASPKKKKKKKKKKKTFVPVILDPPRLQNLHSEIKQEVKSIMLNQIK